MKVFAKDEEQVDNVAKETVRCHLQYFVLQFYQLHLLQFLSFPLLCQSHIDLRHVGPLYSLNQS
jgi:hypothetical protein